MELISNDYFSNEHLNIAKKFIPKKFKIYVVKDEKDIGYMISYFLKFIKLKNSENVLYSRYISMDFEFNNCSFKKGKGDLYDKCVEESIGSKEIAIFQILLTNIVNAEHSNAENSNEHNTIFLFYPPDLSEKQTKVLIDLLIEPDIIKVIHGGDSLDIPYLFKRLLKSEDNIFKFCNNLFDTKYICDFLNNKSNLEVKNKCKIYHFLKDQMIISENQFNKLLENEEEMGPIWFINLDIRKLKKSVILYSACDVIYLVSLLESTNSTNLNQIQGIRSNQEIELLGELTSFNYLYKSGNFKFSDSLDRISNFNVHVITDNNKESYESLDSNYQFMDVFYLYYYNFTGLFNSNEFYYMSEINSLKKLLQNIVRLYVYSLFFNYERKGSKSKYGNIKTSLKKEDVQLGMQIIDEFENYILKWNKLKKTNRLINFVNPNKVPVIRSKSDLLFESCFLLKLTEVLKKFVENDFFISKIS